MGTRIRHLLVVVLVGLLALSTVPGLAAAETRAGGNIVVAEGETVGSLEAFGGEVIVRGTVDGDLNAFGGNVRIHGTVTGDVEAAAGNVELTGTVEGDVSGAAGNVLIGPDGIVSGSLEAGAGTVTIAGTIDGNVRVAAETITIAQTARIGGDVEYDGVLDQAAGAQIGGSVTRNENLNVGGPIPQLSDLVFSAYFLVVNLIVGAILLLVFPGFSRGLVRRTTERPGVTGIAGLGVLVGTPILLVLIAITIVGIPISIVGMLTYLVAIWLAIVYGRYLLGAWLLSLADYQNRWVALLLGVFLMAGVTRLPMIGGLADLAVLVWGLGALVMALSAAYRSRRGGVAGTDAGPADPEGDAAPA